VDRAACFHEKRNICKSIQSTETDRGDVEHDSSAIVSRDAPSFPKYQMAVDILAISQYWTILFLIRMLKGVSM
jgi:hypothetical protein